MPERRPIELLRAVYSRSTRFCQPVFPPLVHFLRKSSHRSGGDSDYRDLLEDMPLMSSVQVKKKLRVCGSTSGADSANVKIEIAIATVAPFIEIPDFGENSIVTPLAEFRRW